MHMRRHTGERNYPCPVCAKAFARSDGLRKHLSCYHGGMKPFQCPVCQRSFKGHFLQHLRTHTDEKPFRCETCDHCFAQRSSSFFISSNSCSRVDSNCFNGTIALMAGRSWKFTWGHTRVNVRTNAKFASRPFRTRQRWNCTSGCTRARNRSSASCVRPLSCSFRTWRSTCAASTRRIALTSVCRATSSSIQRTSWRSTQPRTTLRKIKLRPLRVLPVLPIPAIRSLPHRIRPVINKWCSYLTAPLLNWCRTFPVGPWHWSGCGCFWPSCWSGYRLRTDYGVLATARNSSIRCWWNPSRVLAGMRAVIRRWIRRLCSSRTSKSCSTGPFRPSTWIDSVPKRKRSRRSSKSWRHSLLHTPFQFPAFHFVSFCFVLFFCFLFFVFYIFKKKYSFNRIHL